MSAPLPARAVDTAIDWYVRLAAGPASAAEQGAFARWHDADADHAEAWRRVQGLGGSFARSLERVPAPLTRRVLDQASQRAGRRRALKALALAASGAGSLWLLRDPLALPRRWDGWVADASTAVGERRRLRLPDGTWLQLNTASAVDIRFDAHQRLLVLRRGEIEVATAPDPAGRPFSVRTDDGRMRPVGTRFVVRHEAAQGTLLAVSEGAVDVFPAAAAGPLRVAAGRQLRFHRNGAGQLAPLDENALAWTSGLISANRMRLGDFVAELDRYHPGRLRCDPAVAGLRLTAVHRLDGPASVEAVLASLPKVLPVRIGRVTRYWITVGPASR